MNNKSNQIKKQILEEFLKNLSLITHKEFQKKIWIEGLGPQVHSFDEAVCDFFDLGEYIFANPESYGLTDKQLNLLIKFRIQFKDFANEHDWPEEFIDTPEWARIMEMAEDILKAFNYQRVEKS